MPRARGNRKIDNVRWVSFFNFTNTHAAGATVAVNMIGAGTAPETLMRVRGEFSAVIDSTNEPGKALRVTAGMIVVPDGTGTTVLWEPNGDAAAPWFWYASFALFYDESVVNAVAYGGSFARIGIDNKAMRRVRPDEEIQLVVTNTTISGGTGINWAMSARTLFGS